MDQYQLPPVKLTQLFYPQRVFNGYLLSIENGTLEIILRQEDMDMHTRYLMKPMHTNIKFSTEKIANFLETHITNVDVYRKSDRSLRATLEIHDSSPEQKKLGDVTRSFKAYVEANNQ